MAFCVQYDATTGNINATVNTSGDVPACPNQLVLDTPVDTTGLRVNLTTLTLEVIPA